MAERKKTIFEVLKKNETRHKAAQRSAENPVYQDSYGNRPATLLGQKAVSKKEK